MQECLLDMEKCLSNGMAEQLLKMLANGEIFLSVI